MKKAGTDKPMDADFELQLVTTAVKKRKDSIEQFRNANRPELADKEEAELKILMDYMPQQLSEEDVIAEVKKLADEIGATTKADFPKLMPLAMKNLKGKADGKTVKSIVEKILGSN